MTWKILVSAPYMQGVIGEYRHIIEKVNSDIELIVPQVRERLSEQELLELIGDIDGVICGDDFFTARVIRSAPKLKVISKWGTGIDSIDQEEASHCGIAVCNTKDAFTEAVADSVLGYMLCSTTPLDGPGYPIWRLDKTGRIYIRGSHAWGDRCRQYRAGDCAPGGGFRDANIGQRLSPGARGIHC